jgi:choline dehydrogenase-like flavoprotein
MDVTYLPRAARHGARLLPEHEVRTIDVTGSMPTGVSGRRSDGTSFRIEARRGVVVAASAVQSPCILGQSGLGPRDHVGRHFRLHPRTAVAAVYRDPRAASAASIGRRLDSAFGGRHAVAL